MPDADGQGPDPEVLAASERRRYHGIRITRDAITFTVGVLIVIEQVVVGSSANERPYLLALAAAMIGLPVFTSLGEKKEDTPS